MLRAVRAFRGNKQQCVSGIARAYAKLVYIALGKVKISSAHCKGWSECINRDAKTWIIYDRDHSHTADVSERLYEGGTDAVVVLVVVVLVVMCC